MTADSDNFNLHSAFPNLKKDIDDPLVRHSWLLNNRTNVVDRILSDRSIMGILMIDKVGRPVLTNMNNMLACQYSDNIMKLKYTIQDTLRNLDPSDELDAIRIKTRSNEILAATEVEETLKRIHAHKGVLGTIIVNHEGIAIKSTLDNATSVLYAGLISQLTEKARNVVRDLDSTNDLTFFKVRSRRHEILVAPDREFILIVIQTPSDNKFENS